MAQHLNNSLRTTQKWDVRDDRTTAALVKCRKGLPLLRPDHPMLTAVLLVISKALSRRFEALGEIADINDSIIFLGESLTISPSSQDGSIGDENDLHAAARSLNILGDALTSRFMHSKNSEDVDAAIDNYRMALALSSPDNPTHLQRRMYLARVLFLRFHEHGRREDVDEVIQLEREFVSSSQTAPDEDDTYGSLALHFYYLGSLLKIRYTKFSLIVDLEDATESYEKALALLPNNDERRPDCLRGLAVSLLLTFEAKGQIGDLDGAIGRVREVIACLSDGNIPLDEGEIVESLAQDLNLLGDLLISRYLKLGLIVDLEQATESYEKALALLPNNDERRPPYLRALAVSLHLTFNTKGQIEDIDGAIDHLREAIACLSGENDLLDEAEILGSLAQNLNLLGDLLISRHRKLGLIVDLEQATESYEKALALLPNNDEMRHPYLIDLAVSLHSTFKAKGQIEDLDGAIDRMREALACLSNGIDPADKGETCIFLGFLASILDERFRCTGERADLDEAIQCQYQSMELNPTKRYSALDNLSAHFYARYLNTGDRNDLERALGFSREALELCPVDDSSTRLQIKRHVALYLDARFERSDRAEDLVEGLKIRRELVALTKGKDGHHEDVKYLADSLVSQWRRDPGQLGAFDEGIQQLRDVLPTAIHGPARIDLLERLAIFLHNRYLGSDAPEDLEEAITYLRELTVLVPRGYKPRAKILSHLASALQYRFKLFGRSEDIDDAVDSARDAVKITRSSHGRDDLVECLSILATCLYPRLHRDDNPLGVIEEAITVQQEVVSLSPDDGPALRNLALIILERQKRLKQSNGIEEAIILLRKSLALIPAGHPDKLWSLDALAEAALWRCYLSGGIEYQEEALDICHESVAAQRQLASDKSYCDAVGNLAEVYWIKGDYEEAFTRYEHAANMRYATPRSRFRITARWASRAMQAGHSSSLRANTKALELLDQCLTSTPTIDLQHQFLTRNPGDFASNAAVCAIEKEELEIAVQVLEQGRALLWSRMRGYRHSIEQLQESNPGLAEEFKGVCQQLEHITVSSEPNLSGMAPISVSTPPYAAHGLDFDAKVTKNRQLSDDYERIISEIRHIDGFSSFLQATPFSTLQTAAREGPVILVNVNEHRSDAIILQATEAPLLVPLPENLFAMVDTLSSRLVVVDRINRDEDRKGVARQPKQLDMGNILQLLWESVCQLIALALQEMGHPTGSRVWWCPVGRLNALPLHAAGIYNNKGVLIEGLPNLYVSSYTPTLSSLITSRETAVKGGSGPRLLAVGQSNALPKVKDELFKLKNLFPSHVLRVRDDDRAQADSVLLNLRDHSWVHFACHGSLDASSPFKSGFMLHDKKLSIRNIMQAKLPNAELAFLAACHSAASESMSKTPDEVLTLAAAMQFCGFRSIVGTLWTMSDNDGPVLAEKFYKHMLRNGLDHTDVRDSAEAVHLATKSMREAGVPLHRWTTFVHVGI
ncbi:hypothetical protein PHLCEN_2v13125 [Hermanssonia centrifuga]|uniref:CHAT domain-containing protein n=1 Tax=Hermanssonia centrifuga TaxID=98765 RepID=A0A2R6NFC7_9APHY|nr:hypothetical protein PHLCEN_2v13125 [Hermanssonia centrifuga]